jgi:molecular chaperone DnaK
MFLNKNKFKFSQNLIKNTLISSFSNTNYKFNLYFKNFSVIGLDMGGTNTCIAVMEPNGPRVIENAEGLRTTPSYLSISEDGLEYVAVAGKRISVQNLYSSFYGTKYFFGRKFSDEFVQNLIKRFPFKIEKGPNDEIYFLTDKNKHYTSKTISILYLKYVRDQAEALTGKPVKKVVMSYPTFIQEHGLAEIKETVKECGMDVVKFIEESKAAAYAYNLDKNDKINKFLVFNFGGLNFSLSLLEKKGIPGKKNEEGGPLESENKSEGVPVEKVGKVEEKKDDENYDHFEIKNEFFDYYLGGEDMDQLITKFLLTEFERLNKMDISQDLFALQRIKEASEKAKVELSLSQQAEISLPFLAADQTGPKHLNLRISRSKFETIIDPIISKLKINCENFLKNNSIDKSTLDDIILVGGISRVPRVQEIIKLIFGRDANKTLNPEEAPSVGASILASSVKLKIEEIKNMNSLPLSIGVETLGGNFARLIPRDTPLPLKITKTFTTVYDNQPRIDLKFYFGEREITSENKLLSNLSMTIPLAKKGEPRINVTFNVNNKGDMTIQAVESLSKKINNYSLKINTGLTQEIVEDLLEVSEKMKEGDKAKKDLIELKVEADNFIYNLEKLVKENEEELQVYREVENKEDFERVNNDMEKLNELLKGEEFEQIINTYQALQKDYEIIESFLDKK